MRPFLALLPILLFFPTTASAQTVGSRVTIDLGTSDAERRTIRYTCEGVEPFSVEYVNAEPNFFALVPIEGRTLIMAAVLSASGARYAAGPYAWWTRGPEADLYDLTLGEDADPIATCSEFTETP